MSGNKDSAEVVKFMTLFQKLRDWTDDDPEGLTDFAAADDSVGGLCDDVNLAAAVLSMNLHRRRNIFAAPVDPKFIATWRDYEERYAQVLRSISFTQFLSRTNLDWPNEKGSENARSSADIDWEYADDEAGEQVLGIEEALYFAEEQASDEGREFAEGHSERILEGVSAWDRLKTETGFDLRGVFRRRELIPFVLIPRHVANRYGSGERISLYTHLQQAHDAFIFGAPFAAITLMRSIMELLLREHYGAEGAKLEERINNCNALPNGAGKPALHRLRKLANDILHFNKNAANLPDGLASKEIEKQIVSLLFVLQRLIEGAPAWRAR